MTQQEPAEMELAKAEFALCHLTVMAGINRRFAGERGMVTNRYLVLALALSNDVVG